jgi:hypothetical protein
MTCMISECLTRIYILNRGFKSILKNLPQPKNGQGFQIHLISIEGNIHDKQAGQVSLLVNNPLTNSVSILILSHQVYDSQIERIIALESAPAHQALRPNFPG